MLSRAAPSPIQLNVNKSVIFFAEFKWIIFREPETIALSDIVEIHTTWTDRCLDFLGTMISCCACSKKPVRAMEIYTNTANVLNRVDKKARKIFPLVFLCMNIFYWTAFIYILWNISSNVFDTVAYSSNIKLASSSLKEKWHDEWPRNYQT